LLNWPNKLTLLRIILTPIFITTVLYHRLDIGFFIFIIAALTDALDGYIARTFNLKTQLGTVLDPLADKLLVASAFLSLSLVKGLPQCIDMPIYVPIVVLSRDVIILVGAVTIYFVAGRIDVKPSILGKVTTFFQMLTIVSVLLRFVYSSWIWNTAVVLSILSGLDYLRIGARQVNGKV